MKHGRGSDPAFDEVIPEEVVGEMFSELWERRDHLENMLSDEMWSGDRSHALIELANLEESLGLTDSEQPIRTGDPLADYWMAKQLAGTITPEDLEMTEEDLKLKRGRR